ncbi:MAG: hypothetical protein U5K72_02905 [Balneolaceae bacterium]|nr:hypothetical protein [Balneolaceae bacterium]
MSRAPRTLDLSDDEVKVAQEVFQKFNQSNLEAKRLFDLFKEWQTLKTRSLKRFVLSLSFLLTISWLINVDITDIKPLGINVSGADETLFLISLLIIHVVTFIYYRVQRSIDLNVNEAEISLFEEELSQFIELSDFIDEIIKEGRAKSLRDLMNDVHGSIRLSGRMPKVQDVYNAVIFFKNRLRQEQAKKKWTEKIETISIYALSIADISIIISF